MDKRIQKKLDKFFSKYKRNFTTYKKGEILIRAEEEPSGIFYLKEGVVRMYAISMNGEEQIINIYKPISFFPMSWVLNNTLSHYYHEALTSVSVYKAPKQNFLKFLKKEPDVVFDLMKRIYLGLDGFFMRMEYLMRGTARARLITELLTYAKRFGEKQGKGTLIKLKLTEKDLASQSGMARETVSREIQKLKKSGLIDFKGNQLIVNDLEALEATLVID